MQRTGHYLVRVIVVIFSNTREFFCVCRFNRIVDYAVYSKNMGGRESDLVLNQNEKVTSWTTAGDGFPLCVSATAFPICTLSSNSDGRETSFMFPLARSSKNSAGFMEISGEHPMDWK